MLRISQRSLLNILVAMITNASLTSCEGQSQQSRESTPPRNQDWRTYGGNPAGNRYSPLTQINRDNVQELTLTWTYNTGENNDPEKRPMNLQCQPIVVRGTLYGTTPQLKLFALDAATGQNRWTFDPFADPDETPRYHPLRGVTYWEDGDDRRILYGTGTSLFASNATTGRPISDFGQGGFIDLHEGLGDEQTLGHDVSELSIRMTTPGVIYRDLLIVGSSMSESGDAPPGHIRAFNVRTGELAWVFHTIPQPGEFGYETWSPDSYQKLGGANCWAGMVVDEQRGVVYAGTGSPSVDFYGGARHGKNLFANCVLALDATTGKRLWHFQTVHHDLWDLDLPCPPNLVTVTREGRPVDAVAQATKDGYVFLLDRDTGEPLFKVEEVAVPTFPALPGEQPWPTQPVPSKPAPFAMQELTDATITHRTPEARKYVLDRFRNSRSGSRYMPPSEEGSLYFAFGGGAEWGGNAADPDGILYQNSNNMLWWLIMKNSQESPDSAPISRGAALFSTNCSACHGMGEEGESTGQGAQAYPVLTDVKDRLTRSQISSLLETGRGRMPSFQHIPSPDREQIIDYLLGKQSSTVAQDDIHQSTPVSKESAEDDFPYLPPYVNNGNTQFRDQDNYPAVEPPWGTLNAIDLNTGEYRWQVPLGEYPALTKQGIPPTGTENHGGPIVTAGGLVFIAATYDETIRAFDQATGEIVWEYKLPAGGFATPITYMVNGKQYLVIAAGGTRYDLPPGGTYEAFALP